MNFNKRVAFHTLGCKVNQYETESIKNQLLKKGYEEVSFEEMSDIYIINSCTVTSIADRKTRNMLRRAKRINPNGKVIVTGCYAQTNSREILEIEDVDYVIDNKNKSNIINFVEAIEDLNNERHKQGNIFQEREYQEYEFATLREMSRAYVKIQDGCNQFCSYCKIPYARGRSRSRTKENILKEINRLVKDGFKEIILIGINLGAYGEDFKEKDSFENLVREILKVEKLERVRIGSVYPDKLSDDFIDLFKNKKMAKHLHISLQSCDDTVLKNMRRNYGASLIKERLLKLKEKVKNIEFTADVIVGFPKESEEMFWNTYKLIEEIKFSNLHIFQYSDREDTIASKMEGKIDSRTKKFRADKLEELKNKMFLESREKYLGKTLAVLLEEEKEGEFLGYSDNYLKVKLKNNNKFKFNVNEIVDLKIEKIEEAVLVGEKGDLL
ncbi:MAG: tRNA (N(6)-L-threonylcarbamoyladenosine(37)-C(2))-methylthiotransferase MtaB [Fusobacterium sp.]|uniref:tRNA (N(6)-L-threonylcarbamoyladenosine(37)-C(2))- methylthiotransferase MtaB n=1 Tax=Fusobacterium sp. TaxID=68766 RepID=UPI0026DDB2B8|nr:tRNA (N(6)-L-threonylcarbamoyladenosine(37)-C(2))-methylthiotransferase MtaB [Fusobacterium sp.]MDO4691056.1 tRNA (N(6)-L-threonylcarbamoyladenosine(37)-C(2))-methylthiotransferase MtaB [Fusobacterium sp.]